MAVEQRVAEVLLRFKVANQDAGNVKREIKAVEKELNGMSQRILSSAETSKRLAQEIAKVGRDNQFASLVKDAVSLGKQTGNWAAALDKVERELKAIGATEKEVNKVGQAFARAAIQAEELRKAAPSKTGADLADERFSQVSNQVGLFGDVETGLRTVGVGGAAAEIFAIAEAVPRLKVGVEGLPSQLSAAAAALGPFGIAVTAAAAVAAVAVALLNQQAESLKISTRALLNTQEEYYKTIAGGTEVTQEALDAKRDEVEDAKKRRDELLAIQDQTFTEAQSQWGDFIARSALVGMRAFNVAGINDMDAEINILNQTIADGEFVIGRYEGALADSSLATVDATLALEEYNKKVEEATPRLEQLAEQANNLREQEAERALEITEERRIRDEREQEQWDRNREREETRHFQRLTSIGLQGMERLAQIRQQGNDKIAAIEKDILKLNDQKTAIDKKYMESEREAFEKFRKEEEKATKSANKERLRRLQDLNNELLDAEEANDVVAFIQAKRKGELDLQRMAEDADEQTKERQEQFDEERRLSDQKHQEELARIDAEIAARFEARKQIELDTQAALEAERARIKTTKEETQAAFDEQRKLAEEDRAYRLKLQAEDDNRADAKRKAALDKALADIDAKTRKEAEGIGLVGNAMLQLVNAVRSGALSAITSILALGNAPVSGGLNPLKSNSGGGKAFTPTAFASGGIATRPTVGMLAERPGFFEAAIPFRPSEGIGAALERLGLGGGSTKPNVTFNFNGNIGEGVNTARVEAFLTDVVVRGMAMAVDRARQP